MDDQSLYSKFVFNFTGYLSYQLERYLTKGRHIHYRRSQEGALGARAPPLDKKCLEGVQG